MSVENVELHPRPQFTIELWSINRWLRYTGFRLVFICDLDPFSPDAKPSRVGFCWYGWKGWLYGPDGSK